MGSSTYVIIKPQTAMADGKKSIKEMLKKPFQRLFQKSKKKEKRRNENTVNEKPDEIVHFPQVTDNEVASPFDNLCKRLEEIDIKKNAAANVIDENDDTETEIYKSFAKLKNNKPKNESSSKNPTDCEKASPLDDVSKGLEQLKLDKEESENDKDELLENFDVFEIKTTEQSSTDDDEFRNFSTKEIPDDKAEYTIVQRTASASQSSEDSGFSEKCSTELDDKNVQSKDSTEEEPKPERVTKGPRKQLHYVKRGPVPRTHRSHKDTTHPYSPEKPNQINKIHPQTLSGGRVIVNTGDIIGGEESEDITKVIESLLSQDEIKKCYIALDYALTPSSPEYSNDAFTNHYSSFYSEFSSDLNSSYDDHLFETDKPNYITPPNSVTSFSLCSPNPNSNVSAQSPDMSSMSWNSEMEQFSAITPHEPCTSVNAIVPESPMLKYKNLKGYKDRQKELAKEFSRMDCCQMVVRPSRDILKEQLKKLPVGQRRTLCVNVARIQPDDIHKVLVNILKELSDCEQADDIKVVMFAMFCERVLCEYRNAFVEDFGLELLKFASLRCYRHPIMTRYLVECIRAVTRTEGYNKTDSPVFCNKGVDDTLLIKCVREGDKCANALRELVRKEESDVPLFDVMHVNIDGHSALHVCCSEHCASAPRVHTLHVLLQHAGADCWQKDRKGGETALHMAVNSVNCDLDLILIYFHFLERKDWYRLAHIENRSGKNPLEYAKSAKKSRPSYPREIMDFLERCRKSSENKTCTLNS